MPLVGGWSVGAPALSIVTGHLSKAGPLDMPKSPKERQFGVDTVVRLVYGQRAYLLQLDAELQFEKLLDCILEEVDLAEGTGACTDKQPVGAALYSLLSRHDQIVCEFRAGPCSLS